VAAGAAGTPGKKQRRPRVHSSWRASGSNPERAGSPEPGQTHHHHQRRPLFLAPFPPKTSTPYKPKNFKTRCRLGITGSQPSNTRRSRKSRYAARPGKTHPARGLPGYLAGFPDERFGAPFCRGKTSQKQATKRAGSGGLLTKNQRSNIPSYFLESFDAPDALNGLRFNRLGLIGW